MKINLHVLKIAMAKKKMNQVDLAKTIGVSTQCINYLVRGSRNPSIKMVGKLADALELEVTELIEKC